MSVHEITNISRCYDNCKKKGTIRGIGIIEICLRDSRLSFTAIAKTAIRFNGELSRCVRADLFMPRDIFFRMRHRKKKISRRWTLPRCSLDRCFCKKWLASEGYTARHFASPSNRRGKSHRVHEPVALAGKKHKRRQPWKLLHCPA